MNREFLKQQELSDEVINLIMAEHGKTVTSLKEQVNTLTTENGSLNEQNTNFTAQLDDLKAKNTDNEVLNAQITELQAKNEELNSVGQNNLAIAQKDFQIQLALRDARARDTKAVLPFIDTEIIKYEDGSLTGFNEQLETIRAEKDFLFNIDTPKEPDSPKITTEGNANPPTEPSTLDKFKNALGL